MTQQDPGALSPRSNALAAPAQPDGHGQGVAIPDYLQDTYWWAYLHPRAVHIFERQWLVNLILWGNFARLRDLALDQLGPVINERVLQIACVYGNFTENLTRRFGPQGSLDVIDVAPIQLRNLAAKLKDPRGVSMHRQDSTALQFEDGSHDSVVLFFLLHEQPLAARRKTLAEALRVTRPGGRIVIVDYHRPHWLNPMRYLMTLVLRTLEPYAMDLWRQEISEALPADVQPARIQKSTRFGGLYQLVVITR